jgi:hypothetical protein
MKQALLSQKRYYINKTYYKKCILLVDKYRELENDTIEVDVTIFTEKSRRFLSKDHLLLDKTDLKDWIEL